MHICATDVLKMKPRTATASISVVPFALVAIVTSNHCPNSGGIYCIYDLSNIIGILGEKHMSEFYL